MIAIAVGYFADANGRADVARTRRAAGFPSDGESPAASGDSGTDSGRKDFNR